MSEQRPTVTIYTDGGCVPNPGAGAWACVLLFTKGDGTEVTKEMSGFVGMTTNSEMELTAAIRALEALKEPCDVDLWTDSQYLEKGLGDAEHPGWMDTWKANGWRRKTGPIQNLAMWMRLDELRRKHCIRPHWVRGHSGDRWNTRCDKLVRAEYRANGVSVPAGLK